MESHSKHGASAEGILNKDLHKMSVKPKCYHCGKTAHHPTQCKYKSFKCHNCQKVGHLASACCSKLVDR